MLEVWYFKYPCQQKPPLYARALTYAQWWNVDHGVPKIFTDARASLLEPIVIPIFTEILLH